MNHGAPRDPSDYRCHCATCEPPDPERDWLAEALAIYHGTTRLLAQREHIVALINWAMDKRRLTLANLRAQAAAVTGPQGDQVRECSEAAERVRR